MAFGIREENIFPMWDWVGGRYSLWSAIGLPIALAIGMSNFKELLSGAYTMDQHFLTAPFSRATIVLLALLGVWYGNFWGAQSHAILPYDHYLRNITKRTAAGHGIQRQERAPGWHRRFYRYRTGDLGRRGLRRGQHAYHQLLHQGTQLIPADFIVPIVSFNPVADHHQWLYANCLSQSQALMLKTKPSPRRKPSCVTRA